MPDTYFNITSDDNAKKLTIAFPSRVVSTNVDAMREQIEHFWRSPVDQPKELKHFELDFKATEFVDSIGLNLIFGLIQQAEERQADVVAWVTSRAVRLIFYTVRLDKKMDIRLLENAAQ